MAIVYEYIKFLEIKFKEFFIMYLIFIKYVIYLTVRNGEYDMNSKPCLKGFVVSSKDGEYGTLVFAANFNKAKAYCEKTEDVNYISYGQLRVHRCPSLDIHAKLFTHGILEYNKNGYVANLYRNLFWQEIDEYGKTTKRCVKCGKYEYKLIPESKVDSKGYCEYCGKRGKVNE
jgi:hypothetical protein